MLLADPRGIIEQSDVRLRVADDGLRTRRDKSLHVFLGIELGEKLFIPIGDVHVNHGPSPSMFEPPWIADAIRLGSGGGRREKTRGQRRQGAERGYAGGSAGEEIPSRHGRHALVAR